MQHIRIGNVVLRRRALAGLFASLAVTACGGAGESAARQSPVMAPATARSAMLALDGTEGRHGRVYSVINLEVHDAGIVRFNEAGQAAFKAFQFDGTVTGFFDGDRVHPIRSLGGDFGHVSIRGLNNHGVVVGLTDLPPRPDPTYQSVGFSWTLEGGMVALSGGESHANAINDKGQIVGSMTQRGISARAVRWDPDGTLTMLGPLPFSLSQAWAINNHGIATGDANLASANGNGHAMVWDLAGNATDLGTLGGPGSGGGRINDRGQVAGLSSAVEDAFNETFSWTPRGGMVAMNVPGYGEYIIAGLNRRGEVAGSAFDIFNMSANAYFWSSQRGRVYLSPGLGVDSSARGLNNRGEMVGSVALPASQGGGQRAVRWPGVADPVYLDTELHRAPAGLSLILGNGINDAGEILVHSNAGLLVLRPGKRGTDAPVLGPIMGSASAMEVGQEALLTLGFTDNSPEETHTASVQWSDNCPSPQPAQLSQSGGTGEVRLQHRFCAAGYFVLKVRVSDSGGRSTEMRREFLVNDPARDSISGKGALAREPGTNYNNETGQPLRFTLWAPFGAASPGAVSQGSAGSPLVLLHGPFHFRSDQVAPPLRDGQLVRMEGTGRFNGRAGYRFQIEANDGDRQQPAIGDRLRVRVSHRDAVSGDEIVDYDNAARAMGPALRMAAKDPTVVVEGGLSLSK